MLININCNLDTTEENLTESEISLPQEGHTFWISDTSAQL